MSDFTYESVGPHIWRIVDSLHICCYLVVGNEKACLLDTANGLGDLRAVVQQITSLPVFVILTHGHLDHIGGTGQFDEVYMNHADLPIYKIHSDMNYRVDFFNAGGKHAISREQLHPAYMGKIHDLQEGNCFDLGGVRIRMITGKGHTPGMMCPLIVEDRIIVFGDACGVAVMLFGDYSSCVSEYRASLHHLKKYENEYDTILRNHGTFCSTKVLLPNVIECCDLILAGKDEHVPVNFGNYKLFACKQPSKTLEGNICYALDKVH